MLQINSKLVILGTLGMNGYDHQKQWYQFAENSAVYLHAKNLSVIFPEILLLQTCYFGYFGHAWPRSPKAIVSTCRKL